MTAFVISDLHLGHRTIGERFCLSRRDIGSTPEERDQALVERWNETVTKRDTVYVLGDVAFSEDGLSLVAELKGQKKVVKGNHDRKFPAWMYERVFQEVLPGVFSWKHKIVFSHAPLHPMCLGHRWLLNVHGHIHESVVMKGPPWARKQDSRYFNACVEQIGFRPFPLSEIVEQVGGVVQLPTSWREL